MNFKMNVKCLLIWGAICSFPVILSGCGGGGSSGSASPPATSVSSASKSSLSSSSVSSSVANTVFNVKVSVPKSLAGYVGPRFGSNIELSAANFAVVSVNLSGDVIERYEVKAGDITVDDNWNWRIKAPVAPRADVVVIADVSKAINLTTTDKLNTEGLMYAPATAAKVDLDIGSTSAYKNLIVELGGTGTFQGQSIDPSSASQIAAVDNIVNNVQLSVAKQDLTGTTKVSDALAVVQAPVATIIKQEVVNLKNTTEGTAVGLVRDDGGLHVFYNDEGNILHESFVGTTDINEKYDGAKFVAATGNPGDKAYILSSNGWVLKSGVDVFSSYNSDGSVTSNDSNADGDKTIFSLTQGFNLTGQKVADIFNANFNTKDLLGIINPASVFAAGAKGYRLKITQPKRYSISYDPGAENGTCFGIVDMLASQANGSCNQVEMVLANNMVERPSTGYNNLFSANVAPDVAGFRSVSVGSVGEYKLIIQFINDAAKTVNFYEVGWTGTHFKLLGTGTWEELTLPNLASENKAVHVSYPKSILDLHPQIWSQSSEQTYVQQNGFLRQVEIIPESEELDPLIVFNGTANTDVISATNYTNPLVGTWGDMGEGDAFTFTNNTFSHIKTQGAGGDVNCKTGVAMGTYTWSPITFVMTLYPQSDTTAVDPNDSCSIETGVKLQSVSGGLKITGDEGSFVAPKISNNLLAGSLVGSWVEGSLVFLDNGHYIHSHVADQNCPNSIEFASYSWDPITGIFSSTPIFDGNEGCGLSDPAFTDGTPFKLFVNDNSLLVVASGGVMLPKTPSVANSIVGTWVRYSGDYVNVITFTTDMKYLNAVYSSSTGTEFDIKAGIAGTPGLEYGTYSYNTSTGAFSTSISIDTNNTWGFSHTGPTEMTVTGDKLTFIADPLGWKTPIEFNRMK